jgi:hypothetical protein
MRLHLLSDLHLEFVPLKPPATDADVVVLAGDIDLGWEGRRWARSHFPDRPVIYVLGNHEFYRHALPRLTETLQRETAGSHIHVLENSAVEIGGFTFLGCTLWTDFRLAGDPIIGMRVAEDIMSDYNLIRVSPEDRRLRANDTAKLHAQSVAWLEKELARRDPARTIVVTHHAPSTRSIPPFHAGSPLNAAFASSLDELVGHSRVPRGFTGTPITTWTTPSAPRACSPTNAATPTKRRGASTRAWCLSCKAVPSSAFRVPSCEARRLCIV